MMPIMTILMVVVSVVATSSRPVVSTVAPATILLGMVRVVGIPIVMVVSVSLRVEAAAPTPPTPILAVPASRRIVTTAGVVVVVAAAVVVAVATVPSIPVTPAATRMDDHVAPVKVCEYTAWT
jgi:hypothetical protein